MVHALRSRRFVAPHGEQDAAVLIDAEHIAAIKPLSELSSNMPVEDLDTLALLPGLIDVHTHINEPGRTEWESFATATRAVAALILQQRLYDGHIRYVVGDGGEFTETLGDKKLIDEHGEWQRR